MADETTTYAAPVSTLSTPDSSLPDQSTQPVRRIRVSFFNPQTIGDLQSSQMERVMYAAAEDLNMDLEIHDAGPNPKVLIRMVDEVLGQEELPDYILFRSFQDTTQEILDAVEAAGVPSLIFQQGPSAAELARIGQPRQMYHTWLGTAFASSSAKSKVEWSQKPEPAQKSKSKVESAPKSLMTFDPQILDGAWTLVVIHDHANGRDFVDLGTELSRLTEPATEKTLKHFNRISQQAIDKIDFYKFSRIYSGASSYDFSWNAILSQLDQSPQE